MDLRFDRVEQAFRPAVRLPESAALAAAVVLKKRSLTDTISLVRNLERAKQV
jgi:hypothetical protein